MRSEAEFLDRLKALAKRDMTIIVSTHRLSLLALVDRLLVFDKGRLVADGPRDEVILRMRCRRRSRKRSRARQVRSTGRRRPMQQSDFAFANDIRAAVELRTPRTRAHAAVHDIGAVRGRR